MKSEGFLVLLLGGACFVSCGGSTSTANDSGALDGTTSSSGGSASSGGSGGSASSGSSGASASSGSSSSSGGGRADAGPPMATNDCPNCPGNQVCCLAATGSGQVTGTCAATASACPGGSSAIQCTGADCNGTQLCCISPGSAGAPATTQCANSCPAGSQSACGDDPADCPGGPAGWACQAVPGTPLATVGVCVPIEGGAPEGGADSGVSPDAGADSEGGVPPPDAGANAG
jgi:hypothetical protein